MTMWRYRRVDADGREKHVPTCGYAERHGRFVLETVKPCPRTWVGDGEQECGCGHDGPMPKANQYRHRRISKPAAEFVRARDRMPDADTLTRAVKRAAKMSATRRQFPARTRSTICTRSSGNGSHQQRRARQQRQLSANVKPVPSPCRDVQVVRIRSSRRGSMPADAAIARSPDGSVHAASTLPPTSATPCARLIASMPRARGAWPIPELELSTGAVTGCAWPWWCSPGGLRRLAVFSYWDAPGCAAECRQADVPPGDAGH